MSGTICGRGSSTFSTVTLEDAALDSPNQFVIVLTTSRLISVTFSYSSRTAETAVNRVSGGMSSTCSEKSVASSKTGWRSWPRTSCVSFPKCHATTGARPAKPVDRDVEKRSCAQTGARSGAVKTASTLIADAVVDVTPESLVGRKTRPPAGMKTPNCRSTFCPTCKLVRSPRTTFKSNMSSDNPQLGDTPSFLTVLSSKSSSQLVDMFSSASLAG
mmetsp:Transcript_67833/g.159683  ORF Transcript_67833/g.159683 Transcript_67833/m.159683 type:complete len:216 (-) Transcript_67833:356-1003(-)